MSDPGWAGPPIGSSTPPPPIAPGTDRRGIVVLAAVVAAILVTAVVVVVMRGDERPTPIGPEAAVVGGFPRDLDAYRGLGAWIDVFDYDPAYQSAGTPPVLGPSDIPALAAQGVRTVYLQAARLDDRTPTGLVDPILLGRFLEAAHREGIRVVAWYLPELTDVAADLDRLARLRAFEQDGQRFDGLAVDMESRELGDPVERSRRIVDLSAQLRASLAPGEVVGAIVLPPVLLEVVNDQFWPQFPWAELAGLYDVWLPMAYWTDRREDSGYRNGFAYVDESVRRMRTNLGRPEAPVHPVGGIGDQLTEASLREYLLALTATEAIGGSIYDVRTTSSGGWAILRHGVPAATGA